ncbi:MAG: helix-turn-helix domain-containing protein [Xanthomonadales bacterium]|nr:helix-turn-helix domain-containing protein [Xanthomonadales bacterium]
MVNRSNATTREIEDDRVFKALASADRRQILDLVRDQPQTTGAIAKALPHLDRTTVMQHLGVLERARLIISKKEGRCRWNTLDVSPIQRIYQRWISDYASPSAALLQRIRDDLEGAQK